MHPGVALSQPSEQVGETGRLVVGTMGYGIAIVVPLHVGHGKTGQERVQTGEQVVAHVGAGEIEHQLVPAGESVLVGCAENPLGVGAVER